MHFSVITPSFRSSNWLKLCIASIADQKVDLEHIVQDAVSDDGTLEWLPQDTRVKAFVEKDQGMYDAVNRGLKRSQGEILSYLNCDEQYLPGTLKTVEQFFEQNPSIEIVFGDAIIINPRGEFLSHRKSILPLKPHSMISNNLAILTCATFFRRSLIEKRSLFFNSQLRDLGDADWVIRCIEQNSVFTDTGENMNLKPNAQREKKALYDSAPSWTKAFKHPIILQHRARKLLAGGYHQKPFQYEIYTASNLEKRVSFDVPRPSGRWNPYVSERLPT
jgi:glycosyltransferase involved in cell wall biosynthesis